MRLVKSVAVSLIMLCVIVLFMEIHYISIQAQDDDLVSGKTTIKGIVLSSRHIEAVNRQRRIIFHYDVGANTPFIVESVNPNQLKEAINWYFSAIEEEPNQIDNICYDWTEGNIAAWQSKILPLHPFIFPKWSNAGINPVRVLLEETRKRGREVFFSYRINGSDNDPGITSVLPMKKEHPDWLIEMWHPFWNFTFQEVRSYKLSILCELAEMYDFDGIQIDFARVPVMFPAGHQWENRDFLTNFMREVRLMLLKIEERRDRPLLLAVRVPENIMGCHFDGMDVERWARENLIDIFVLGCRSSDVDIASFRRITTGTGIKLYPSFDDHHASDGYHNAPIEVYRGVYANWWNQGADGAHTFNLGHVSAEAFTNVGLYKYFNLENWERQKKIFREIGSLETLKYKNKIFIVQRRGAGHWPTVLPNPEDWNTPRHMYFNTNMLAPLPVSLANNGKADAFIKLVVADDVNALADRIKEIALIILLSDSAAANLPDNERLDQVIVGHISRPTSDGCYRNIPPAKGIENLIEVRINNLQLASAHINKGWLVFPVKSRQLAVGDNLLGLRVASRPFNVHHEIIIERIELHVKYH